MRKNISRFKKVKIYRMDDTMSISNILHVVCTYPETSKMQSITSQLIVSLSVQCHLGHGHAWLTYHFFDILTKLYFGEVSLPDSYQIRNTHTLQIHCIRCHTPRGPCVYLIFQDFFQAPSRDRSVTVTVNSAGCIYCRCHVFRSIGSRGSHFLKVTIADGKENT